MNRVDFDFQTETKPEPTSRHEHPTEQNRREREREREECVGGGILFFVGNNGGRTSRSSTMDISVHLCSALCPPCYLFTPLWCCTSRFPEGHSIFFFLDVQKHILFKQFCVVHSFFLLTFRVRWIKGSLDFMVLYLVDFRLLSASQFW